MDTSTSDGKFEEWLAGPFHRLVAEFNDQDQLTDVLAEVTRAGHQRRVARRMVTTPGSGPLVNHVVVDIARYFRREKRGEVDILEVSRATGVALPDCRAVLQQFVTAGLLTERVEPTRAGLPDRRLYELTDAGASGTGAIVESADKILREQQDARRHIGETSWEGA